MTGALNLSLRPLSSAMQSMAVKREGFISRYFCAKNGVADYYQLLEPAVISAGTDFEIEFSCSLNNLTVDSCIVGYKTTNLGALLIYHDAPDGWRVLYYNGTVLTSWSTGIITSNSKLTTYSAVFSGDSVTFSNGSSSATGTLNGLGSVDIYFDLIGNQINTKLLDGIVSNLKLWRGGDRITGQLTDWYKFDTPNSVYQRNHAVPQGVELQSSILGEDFGGFTPESSNGQITIVGDEFRAAKISNNGPANIKRVITLEAGKTYKITVQHSSAELGIRGMAVGSPNDGSGSAKWDYYSGWIYSDSNGRSELVVTLDYNNIWLYLSSGLTVGSYIGYSNVSIQEWSGAEIIGGMPEDWFRVERQPHWKYWLGPEQWGVGSVSEYGSSTYDSESGIAHITNGETTNLSGVAINNGVVDQKYWVNLTVFDFSTGIALYNIGTDSTGYEFSENGHYSGDIVADGVNMNIKRKAGYSVDYKVKNISFRRKLEIAQ